MGYQDGLTSSVKEGSMNAMQTPLQKKTTPKAPKTLSRPVQELLLEIAYRLHANKVIARPRTSRLYG